MMLLIRKDATLLWSGSARGSGKNIINSVAIDATWVSHSMKRRVSISKNA